MSDSNTLSMFFDEEFNAVSYINALFKSDGDKYSKQNLTKLSNTSNNLLVHLNVLINQLNQEINNNLEKLNNIVYDKKLNNSTRMNYFISSLNNSILLLNNELNIPEYNQLVVVSQLVNYKTIKENIINTLRNLTFIRKHFGNEISINDFESNLNTLFNTIQTMDNDDKKDNLDTLIKTGDLFQNFNDFNSIYKKNSKKIINERENME